MDFIWSTAVIAFFATMLTIVFVYTKFRITKSWSILPDAIYVVVFSWILFTAYRARNYGMMAGTIAFVGAILICITRGKWSGTRNGHGGPPEKK